MTTGFDIAQTDRLLTTTRAVRKRLDLSRPVERSVVLDCLRVATQAPSGGNTQRWRSIMLPAMPRWNFRQDWTVSPVYIIMGSS